MITFIEENNCIFAVEQNVERNGKFYDELWYAELEKGMHKGRNGLEYDCIKVTWQDDWQHPEYLPNLKSAEQHIKDNYKHHTPIINGAQFDLE